MLGASADTDVGGAGGCAQTSFARAAALYLPVRVRAAAADDENTQQREHHGNLPVMRHPESRGRLQTPLL